MNASRVLLETGTNAMKKLGGSKLLALLFLALLYLSPPRSELMLLLAFLISSISIVALELSRTTGNGRD